MAADKAKSHDALPIPAVEVYARPLGKVQWSCPNCSQEYPLQFIDWRRGILSCSRCKAKHQLGVGFSNDPLPSGFLMGKWNSYCVNAINPHGTFYPAVKLYGSIEWQCPRCAEQEKVALNPWGQVQCSSCTLQMSAAALLWRLPNVSRLRLKAPLDSLLPRHQRNPYETTSVQPVDASSSAKSAGTAGSSLRGDR